MSEHRGPKKEPGSFFPPRRQRFAPNELAGVLSHYDLGVIERIRSYPRGSRQSPKVRIVSQRGEFLLKRRAPGRDNPHRVAFAHSLQLHLARHGMPVAPLVGTRDTNNSMLLLDGRVYELFEFVEGRRTDGSAGEAREAGRVLGSMHGVLDGFDPGFDAPVGGFHDAPGLHGRLAQVPRAVAVAEPGSDCREVPGQCRELAEAYRAAAERVRGAGWDHWPRGFTHGDWHPGNLIYRDGNLVAVLDFDSSRLEPRVADFANAALHLSMSFSDPPDPRQWPDGLVSSTIREVALGYRAAAAHTMGDDEYGALPWLMIEALVIESVVPLAASGRFGPIGGVEFIGALRRRIRWIAEHAGALVEEVRR